MAPASIAASTINNQTITLGVDNYTGPTATNIEVPTGAIVKEFDIQLSVQNLVNVAAFGWFTIQQIRSGQTVIDPQAVGGNPQRNQVFLQLQRSIGQNQNVDIHVKFKVPKKFQRVREGDQWRVSFVCDQIRTEAYQFIYKFYR